METAGYHATLSQIKTIYKIDDLSQKTTRRRKEIRDSPMHSFRTLGQTEGGVHLSKIRVR